MRTGNVAAAVALGIGIGMVPGAAAASCAEFPPFDEHLAQAEVVFVGAVTAVTDEQRTALVEVEETWRGPALPAEVTVHGGFEDLGFTSADRYFEAGTRYLFAPSFSEGRLEDNSCTATRPWSDDLAALRPATARVVEGEAAGGVSIPAALLLAGLVVLLVAVASALAFRRR